MHAADNYKELKLKLDGMQRYTRVLALDQGDDQRLAAVLDDLTAS
jgi:hypothetical protein